MGVSRPRFSRRLGSHMFIGHKLVAYFLLIGVVPIALVGYLAFRIGRTSTEGRVTAHLTSIADLKKGELRSWLSNRIGNLETVASDPLIALFLVSSSGGVAPGGTLPGTGITATLTQKELYDIAVSHLETIKAKHGFRRAFLVDVSGTVVASTEKEDIGRRLDEEYLREPLATNDIYVQDIFRSPEGEILMELASPVYGYVPKSLKAGYNREIVGVLALEIDAEESVFRMIGNWPGMGNTGETLLVRSEGDEVLFLNELRHHKNSAMNLRFPNTSSDALPAIFSSQGDEGIIRSRDYRGVDVIAAYRYIPEMNWGFVAKIDEAEAFAAITSLRNKIITVASIVIMASVGLAVWVSRGIVQPILMLERLTKRIAKGDFSVHPEIKTKDEIGRLADSFTQMAQELKVAQDKLVQSQRFAAVGKLSSGVAHDLRNPLGAIANSVYFLKMRLEDADEKVMKHLTLLHREVMRANSIINDLLDFAKGRQPSVEKVEINTILDGVLASLGVPEHITVEKHFDENLPAIVADRNQLYRVFLNLVSNAFESMTDGGRLTIETATTGHYVEIVFKDTGHGIPEEDLYQVFDPFFSTKEEGVGLGLSVVKRIVEAHDGEIEVHSIVGVGSSFTVRLRVEMREEPSSNE